MVSLLSDTCRSPVGPLLGVLVSFAALSTAYADMVEEAVASCTPLYSLQKRQCEVEHVYRCPPPETGYVVVTVEEGIPTGMEFTGPDGQIVGYKSVDDPGFMAVTGVTDEMSIQTLRDTGEEQFEVVIDFALGGAAFDGLTAAGRVTLDGDQKTIGAVSFLTGKAEMTVDFPETMGDLRSEWTMLLPVDENVVLTGESVSSVGTRISVDETEIRQVLVPGDAGFLVNQGLYDCGESS